MADMRSSCRACPRECGADRCGETSSGFCGCGYNSIVAKYGVHMWEEPCISGVNGSGTVFFGGCSLRCSFCQNREISFGSIGRSVSPNGLREIFFELIDKGVHNINLVTPTHFSYAVAEALDRGLPVPVVFNCGGYEKQDTLRLFDGKADIYLPDIKYSLSEPAKKYSRAADYPQRVREAVNEMYRQTGDYVLDENGIMRRGVLIRHLVLPGNLENTFGVIDMVKEDFGNGKVLFSLMSQFTPVADVPGCPELSRTVTPEEYDAAQQYLFDSGIEDGFVQELSSASEDYIPDFSVP